jgi:hypothetical protein
MEIGVIRLGGFAKCGPERLSVNARTSAEQVVKSFHNL